MSQSCVVIGQGRAGGSFAGALEEIGWTVGTVVGDSTPDLVLLCVPDGVIADVSASIPPFVAEVDTVVAHVSGACDLNVLAPHVRRGSIHPLMSLPDPDTGRRRLLDRCTFAVDGDPLMTDVAIGLGGRAIAVDAAHRVLYHATATIAANHLTALCAQVEDLAAAVGVPVDAYWHLMSTTLENVAEVGAAAALTGPAARGDWNTIRTHLAALPTDDDRRLYRILCEGAARLAGQEEGIGGLQL